MRKQSQFAPNPLTTGAEAGRSCWSPIELLSSLSHFRNRQLTATQLRCIAIERYQPLSAPIPPGTLAEPHQRPRPPNFARQRHRRIRSPKLPPIRKQKPYLAQQLLARHSKQSADSRILQRRHRQVRAVPKSAPAIAQSACKTRTPHQKTTTLARAAPSRP